ncbi:MAG: tetratricopeptide repeat protein [Bacteroidota bacterium]|nr:tetratricopeptide repeat protein [Bacteroidota bacterium]
MLTFFKPFIGIFLLFAGQIMAQQGVDEGVELLKNHKIEEARTIFLTYKDSPVAREYLGDIACFRKEWDRGIDYYKTLVKEYPDSADYHFKLGGALGMKAYYGSKFEAALILGDIKKHLKKAADLDPGHLEARRALVELYAQLPEIIGGSKTIAESYVADLERLNELDALMAEGFIYREDQYDELASLKYQQALRIAIKKPELIVRNYLKYEIGEAAAIYELEPEAATALLKDYIENYGYQDLKSPAWAYYRLAQIERAQENKANAMKYINQALTIDPHLERADEEKRKIMAM